MYLKKLHISNFRCFRDYTIEFAPGVTVLFGKNGSGKSTLIHAIHKALSFAFKNDKVEEGELTLSSGFPTLRPNQYRKKEDIVRDEKSGLSLPYICIHAEADFLETTLDWDMYALTSTFALQPSKYKTAYKLLMSRIKETGTFPVFAYFSDSFPHISTKASTLSKTQLSLRNLGYLGWDDETAYSDLWITRLTKIWTIWNRAKMNVMQEESALAKCEKLKASGDINENEYREDVDLHRARLENALKDFNKYNPEISSIRECLVNFSKKLPGIDVQNVFVSVYEEDGLCLETKDGQNPPFEKLPAGYKRIFYMALDIAYRSYILNGTTDSEGIVVIDEIDLHLHPALEQVILQCFQETFPNIQFIVSTHSPLVLTDIDTVTGRNKVMRMTPACDAPEEWRNIHGIDYNQMLEENMDVSKRKPEIQELFDKAWDEVAEKDTEAAKATVAELEAKTPADQIELIQLRAIINRIELIGK
ncbi:MAG: AAA family ATPase [Prevotella sp.]|nr:AAA family ATPase [Prevotella sp.]MDD7068007.1 AAA family ATPase [Prevotella sp.]MDY5289095.1 AAA family ATPase [Prevotella sp.]